MAGFEGEVLFFVWNGVTSSLCELSGADYFVEASFLSELWDILSFSFTKKKLMAESVT